MRLSVTYDLSGVRSLFARAERAFDDLSVGPMRQAMSDIGEEYLAFSRERFINEGDGEWEELAPKTQKQRKWLGFPPAHPILRRLDILLGALTPGAPGNVFAPNRDGIDVGYGGSYVHPGYISPSGKKVGGDIPLVDIAKFHQHGTDKMPAREILVQPDEPTVLRIRLILQAAVNKTLQQMIDAIAPRRAA